MKTNGQVLELFVDLEKEQYDWRKDIIINKSEFYKDYHHNKKYV